MICCKKGVAHNDGLASPSFDSQDVEYRRRCIPSPNHLFGTSGKYMWDDHGTSIFFQEHWPLMISLTIIYGEVFHGVAMIYPELDHTPLGKHDPPLVCRIDPSSHKVRTNEASPFNTSTQYSPASTAWEPVADVAARGGRFA